MEVILQQAIEALGREGEVVKVAPGYANNFLIPKGLAVMATRGNLKQLEQKRAGIEKREGETRTAAAEIAKKFDGKSVTIRAKAGAEGQLYGSVTTKDIAAAMSEDFGVEIDKKQIIPADPIKEAGEVDIRVRLHPDVEGALVVKVVADIAEASGPAAVGEMGAPVAEAVTSDSPEREEEAPQSAPARDEVSEKEIENEE